MNYLGLHKSQLDTPVLVLDKTKLVANLQLMQALAAKKGVNIRPHAKTHKCSELALLQLDYGAIGICVAKVSEAQVMAAAGIRGLLLTSPVVTTLKIAKLIEVLRLAPDTLVVIDSLENAHRLNREMAANQLTLNVLLDIDGGIGRSGVCTPEDARQLALALKELKQLNLLGLQCYAGHLQHIADLGERRKKSQAILRVAGEIKHQLQQLGIPCPIQTGSGSGTFSVDSELECVTEIQPGSYCVMDQEYSNIEYKEQPFALALTMLTSVISNNHSTHVTVDAGTKALYQVTTRPKIISHPGLVYDWGGFGDEHGKVSAVEGAALPPLGEVLELVVAHCDPTINLFDHFYISENELIVGRWEINLRGKLN